ncbi:nuclease-related domain-containing protein [Bacillus sp. FJAT-50079]|uniref:nuclease-related domain-containing protein n=1 Tax=Bacillus sp. FJAT-50079 TaxID=2833577 RepID=UPI001BCA3D47|nr:nuclease-related domain-containing protein [Bacillus sp. FJAT-50079]MBS4208010.1 NERD domain-containing protein [Bacillus sp. FJAT-50079]
MIRKPLTSPVRLNSFEALSRRFPKIHPKREQVDHELYSRRSGYRGEQSLQYYLSFLPEKEYNIFHDLRLPNHVGTFFQIDALIHCSYFFTLIDVKNHGGTIQFDHHFNQFIQTHSNGKIKAYEDPTSQIMRQRSQFKIWLEKNKFPQSPIYPLIIVSNPSTIIETTGNPQNYQHITHSTHIISKIEEFRKRHHVEHFTKNEMKRLTNRLLKQHTPETFDILHHLNIRPEEILTGVHCPSCSFLPMTRYYGKWVCPSCTFSSSTAYRDSLLDYSLLIKPTITNKELRHFLQIPSRNIATNILNSMNLRHIGSTKGRVYDLSSMKK